MKLTNPTLKGVLTLMMLTVTFGLSAQIALETPYEKADRILTNSPLIFEGIVVEQTLYEAPVGGNCWTSSRVVITRIFKGMDKIQCGDAILISRGSSGQWADFGQGAYWQDGGSHSMQYREGTKGIFFL